VQALSNTEAARGNLQVLRIILAILDHQPRYRGQRFGSVDTRLGGTDLAGVDGVDCSR
jgi:hypothetical protein